MALIIPALLKRELAKTEINKKNNPIKIDWDISICLGFRVRLVKIEIIQTAGITKKCTKFMGEGKPTACSSLGRKAVEKAIKINFEALIVRCLSCLKVEF